MKIIKLLFIIIIPFASFGIYIKIAKAATPPYPASSIKINFNWSTHKRLAQGSDNWPITWASDGYQYTTWGDGGGFGGTNTTGRVSLGVARVGGGAYNSSSYTTCNVAGGVTSSGCSSPASSPFTGKNHGILAIGNTLYMFRDGDASTTSAYKFTQLYRSTDYGRNWSYTGVEFTYSDGIFAPTFLQYGQGYTNTADVISNNVEYVYIYATNRKTDSWVMHIPGEIILMRVPKSSMASRSAYQFFSGRDSSGNPTWSSSISSRRPVFEDRVNGARLTTVSYNKGLGRYFLITEHNTHHSGEIGIYDAPKPWGPWTTVLFEDNWGSSAGIESSTFFWSFSNKWLSSDGRNFQLVFSGVGTNDSWNTVQGYFTTGTVTSTPTPTQSPTSSATPTPTPNILPGGSLIGSLVVNDSTNSSDWSLLSNLVSGVKQYGDRSYTIQTIPDSLRNNEWIQTANDSKSYTGSTLATFKAVKNIIVYVAHDDRINTKPSWLSGWNNTGLTLINSEPRSFSIYSRNFSSGSTVTLGPNGSTGYSMYTVIAKDQTAVLRGDADGDGDVDDDDYSIWLTNYNLSISGGSSVGDFNNDGKVDGSDYVIWVRNYTG